MDITNNGGTKRLMKGDPRVSGREHLWGGGVKILVRDGRDFSKIWLIGGVLPSVPPYLGRPADTADFEQMPTIVPISVYCAEYRI